MKTQFYLILIFAALLSAPAFSQDSQKDLARTKCDQAVQLADQGKTDESIKLLQEASNLDPSQIRYPSELAYSLYLKGNIPGAIDLLDRLTERKDANEHIYLFLGSLLDQTKEDKGALMCYQDGLRRFPHSSSLHSAMAGSLMKNKQYYAALSQSERGIEAQPALADNYYTAALIYCHSTEKVWGMIYGEMYLNLNAGKDSLNAQRISNLLYDTYKSSIQLNAGNTVVVDFSKSAESDGTETATAKLPFQVGVYESLVMKAIKNETVIDLFSLNLIRTEFLKTYIDKGYDSQYPNLLFSYQAAVAEAGFLDAYNYWLLGKANPAQFDNWLEGNKKKYDAFLAWKASNPVPVTDQNYFSSAQYSMDEKPEQVKIDRKIDLKLN